MHSDKPHYEMTGEYRPEDAGQKLMRNRMIKKTMVQDYQFSYMDAHMLHEANKKALQGLKSQKQKIDMDIELQEKEVEKWAKEIATLEAEFPELKEESTASPIQPDDDGTLREAE